jgi:cytochrome c-type biogenesis protein CcmH/NrfF
MSSPMIMVDTWTIWMAAIAAVQIAIALVVSEAGKRKEKIFV